MVGPPKSDSGCSNCKAVVIMSTKESGETSYRIVGDLFSIDIPQSYPYHFSNGVV